jgi:hypothetical protein
MNGGEIGMGIKRGPYAGSKKMRLWGKSVSDKPKNDRKNLKKCPQEALESKTLAIFGP